MAELEYSKKVVFSHEGTMCGGEKVKVDRTQMVCSECKGTTFEIWTVWNTCVCDEPYEIKVCIKCKEVVE